MKMPLYLIFFTSFLIGLSGALSPGPLLIVTIDETIKKDFKAGPLIITGHSFLELLMVIILIFGLGDILKNSEVQKYMSIFGGIFLIYFGISTFFSKYEFKKENYGDFKSTKNYILILKGIFISLSNPYWTVWWITVGLIYLSFALPYGFWGIFLFFTGHILSDFFWYSTVSYFIYSSREIFTSKIKYLSFSLGSFLVIFGGFLILKNFI